MASSSAPRVVICGPAKSGKRSLVSGLFKVARYLGQAVPESVEAASIVQLSGADVASYSWRLETKYYDADLEVLVLPSTEFAEPTAVTAAALERAEALVLVLDAGDPASFMRAAGWPALAAAASLPCMLCVVNRCDAAGGLAPGGSGEEEEGGRGGYGSITPVGSAVEASVRDARVARAAAAAAVPASHRAFLSAVAEWSLDHGFEAVEAVATQPLAGSAGRDKAGIARVYEALQSTMWSTMVRKPVGGAAGGVLRLATLEAELQEEGAAAAGMLSQYEAPSAPGISSEEREEGSLEGMLASMRLAAAVGRGDAAPEAGVAAAEQSMGAEEEEEEDELDVGSLMAQMQAVRAAAVKGGMGDDERRERAAAMALRLLQLMGDGGPNDE